MSSFAKVNGAKKRVIFGFNGGADSIVGAYLLKKQGIDVIAVAVSFSPNSSEALPPGYEEKGRGLSKIPFIGDYLLHPLDDVQRVAKSLGLTFYVTDASQEYKDRVTDFLVGAKIGGEHFASRAQSTALLMDVLAKKARSLGIEKIATGHFAKIALHKRTDSHGLFVAQDIHHDQSYDLSLLSEDILSQMILPLSEMRKDEAEKIRRGLKIEALTSLKKRAPSFQSASRIGEFARERFAPSLIRKGNIINYTSDEFLGKHKGIHLFAPGMDNIKSSEGVLFDKSYVAIGFKYSSGIVYVAKREELFYQSVILQNLIFSKGVDESRPFEVFVKKEGHEKAIGADLYIHNNSHGEIEFKQRWKGLLFPGEYLVLYNRAEGGGKVIGHGIVKVSGLREGERLRTFPKRKDEIEDEKRNEYEGHKSTRHRPYSFKF